jgi:hypothetical protein
LTPKPGANICAERMEEGGSEDSGTTTLVIMLAGSVALSASAYAYVMYGMDEASRAELIESFPGLKDILGTNSPEDKPSTDIAAADTAAADTATADTAAAAATADTTAAKDKAAKDKAAKDKAAKDKAAKDKAAKDKAAKGKANKWAYYGAGGGDCFYHSGGKLCMGKACEKKPSGQFAVSRTGDRFAIRNEKGQCMTAGRLGKPPTFTACKNGDKSQLWKPLRVPGGVSHMEIGGLCIAGLKKGGSGCGKSPVMLPCSNSGSAEPYEFRWKSKQL